jgi:hypothetical protein
MIPRRYAHFVFAVLQSGLTCLVASGIGSFPATSVGEFFEHWFLVWLVSWATMLPVVVLAAPMLRALANNLTHE